jgi:hypothetical protein
MSHNACSGSSRYVAHQERVVCGALGETFRVGRCPDCLQTVVIGPDDRLIRHRPQAIRPMTARTRDERRVA